MRPHLKAPPSNHSWRGCAWWRWCEGGDGSWRSEESVVVILSQVKWRVNYVIGRSMRIPRSPPRLLSLLLLAMVALASYFAGLASHSNFILPSFLAFHFCVIQGLPQLEQNLVLNVSMLQLLPSNLKMLLCLLDFANRFVQIYLTVGVQNFSWKKGLDANCTPSRVSEKGAFINQSFYVRHDGNAKRTTIWMLQFFLSHLAAVLASWCN